jgi:hypothetical protein
VCDYDDKGECAETVVVDRDQDRGKGEMEQDDQNQGGNTSMQGQLGHRDEDAALKNADADLSGGDLIGLRYPAKAAERS